MKLAFREKVYTSKAYAQDLMIQNIKEQYLQGNMQIENTVYNTEREVLSKYMEQEYRVISDVSDVYIGNQERLINYHISLKVIGVGIRLEYVGGILQGVYTQTGMELFGLMEQEYFKLPQQVHSRITQIRGVICLCKKDYEEKIDGLSAQQYIMELLQNQDFELLHFVGIGLQGKEPTREQQEKQLEKLGVEVIPNICFTTKVEDAHRRLYKGSKNLGYESVDYPYMWQGVVIQKNINKGAKYVLLMSNDLEIQNGIISSIDWYVEQGEYKPYIMTEDGVVLEVYNLKTIWLLGLERGGKVYYREGINQYYLCDEVGKIVVEF